MIIKIARNSVRENPDAGIDSETVIVEKYATFSATVKIPESVKDLLMVTSERFEGESYECEGVITNLDDCDTIAALDGFSVTIEQKAHRVKHLPAPKFLFEYESPSIQCETCGLLIPFKQIPSLEDMTICPKCSDTDSFDDIEYEKIEVVAKELGLS